MDYLTDIIKIYLDNHKEYSTVVGDSIKVDLTMLEKQGGYFKLMEIFNIVMNINWVEQDYKLETKNGNIFMIFKISGINKLN